MRNVLWPVLATLLVASPAGADPCSSNLLILLDRSCSMQDKIKDPMTGVSKAKWDIATHAIDTLTAKYGGTIQFGLSMFPDKNVTAGMCIQGADAISPAAGTAATITKLLSNTQPNGPCVTNIDQAVKQARVEPAFKDMTRRSFVLLITDGMQSGDCNGGPAKADPLTVGYLKDLYNAKVPTYVIGFNAAASSKSLDAFAVAGGLPDPVGQYKFYLANSETDLNQVLDTVGGKVSGTEFGCTGLPCPDNRCLSADQVCVAGTCQPLPQDLTGGGGRDLAVGTSPDGGGGGTVATGCSCKVADRAPGSRWPVEGVLIIGLAMLWRRRGRT